MVAVAQQGLVEMNALIEEGQGTSLEGSPASGDEDKKAMGSGPGKYRLGGPVTMNGRHKGSRPASLYILCHPRRGFHVLQRAGTPLCPPGSSLGMDAP